jgi:hypothetical protein
LGAGGETETTTQFFTTSAMELTQNQAYGTSAGTRSVVPEQLEHHQQQDVENEAHRAMNIPVNPNHCYGITTPSVDSASGDYDYAYVL